VVSHFLLVQSFPVDALRGREGGGLCFFPSPPPQHFYLSSWAETNYMIQHRVAICACCYLIRQLHIRHKCVRIYGLFNGAIIYHTVQRRIAVLIVNSELQKMWNEAAVAL